MSFPELNDVVDDQAETWFADVILPLALPKNYTYRIPFELNGKVNRGQRVLVQFGKTRVYSAVVYSLKPTPPAGYQAKYILSVLDEHPVVNEFQLKLWQWISEYYMCTLGEVMHSALPSPFRLESETKITGTFTDLSELSNIDEREYLILEALEISKKLSISQITQILNIKNVFPWIRSLYTKGLIVTEEELHNKIKPRLTTYVRLSEDHRAEEKLQQIFNKLEKSPKQLELLMSLIHLENQDIKVSKKNLLAFRKGNSSAYKSLLEKGIIEQFDEKTADENPENDIESFDLNETQIEKLNEINDHFKTKDVVLLHGVTSSGKTHIYSSLIEKQIEAGKQVLYLLPEIALTSQMIDRLQRYFGNSARVFHSKISEAEKIEVWEKVQDNTCKIVLGARSSLFLPFNSLGLVIVDEEHENSFKQYDPDPRYHARDTAIYLAGLWKSKTLLGSATPSLESYYNTETGRYGLVEIMVRFGGTPLPDVGVADIAAELKRRSMKSHFSSVLLREIEKAVEKKEQVILFQNRRGYAPVTECQNCGWAPKCINCDITLTYYRTQEKLKCHYCGYSIKPPSSCPACSSTLLKLHGFGTEKIEDELKLIYPDLKVQRFDLDTTRGKYNAKKILVDFEQGLTDVLVGTQMASKGLDFHNVGLVGILNADQILNFPDFRASERAYQLMSQVSGRAGRRGKQGRVIIQTYRPTLYLINDLIHSDYKHMYKVELNERKKLNYPPFSRLISLTIKSKKQEQMIHASEELGRILKAKLGNRILGPTIPFISRIRNYYLSNILLKVEKDGISLVKVKEFVKEELIELSKKKEFRQVFVNVDVDPV